MIMFQSINFVPWQFRFFQRRVNSDQNCIKDVKFSLFVVIDGSVKFPVVTTVVEFVVVDVDTIDTNVDSAFDTVDVFSDVVYACVW